ncbi:22052_t:CDS:2, partial [Cetraspora pellucida]
HFILGFVLFGGKFDDVMKPIVDEINILEKDTKHYNNSLGCRSCLVPKEQLNVLLLISTFTKQTYKELDEALKIKHILLQKNIEFDFIYYHNTLQMIYYLIDEGEDSCFQNVGQGFQNFIMDPLLQPILSDWYMMQNIQEEDMFDIDMQ